MRGSISVKHFVVSLALLIMLFGAAYPGEATIITLNRVDLGWYDNTGYHKQSIMNYLAGGWASVESRNFFVFDLSSVSETITSAELRVQNPSGGYKSGDPTETYTMYDVSTSVAALRAGGWKTAIFADLGSGTSYGSRVVSAADNNTNVTIDLNSSAISALNASSGLFALGGAITTLGTTNVEYVFAFSGVGNRQLILDTGDPIPEPSTILLLTTGLGGIVAYGKLKVRRRKKA